MNIILILSGGMDSTVLLYQLLHEGHTVHAMGVNYGQRHGKELDYAKATCAKLNVPFEVADLTAINHLLKGSSQSDPDVQVPEGHYAAENMKLTVVPNRNMIMLSVAMGYAISLKLDAIAYAVHGGDHAIYPDCRPEFADAMDKIAKLADWHQLTFLRPFINCCKADIAQIGLALCVPFEETWSCYKGDTIHCGKCGTCVERREALEEAGVTDPTVYACTLDETKALKAATAPSHG